MRPGMLLLASVLLLTANAAFAHRSISREQARTDQLNRQSLQSAQMVQSSAPVRETTVKDAVPKAAPTSPVVQNDMAAPATGVPLASMTTLPSSIKLARIVDNKGVPVGMVHEIEMAPNGAPRRVDVALMGEANEIVAINASLLTYNAVDNVLIAQASAGQIRAMPALSHS